MGGSAGSLTSDVLAPVTGGLSVLGYSMYSKQKDAEKAARTAADQEKDALNQQNANLTLEQQKEKNAQSNLSSLNMARMAARNAPGAPTTFGGTLLTSPLGVTNTGQPATKTLLGQ